MAAAACQHFGDHIFHAPLVIDMAFGFLDPGGGFHVALTDCHQSHKVTIQRVNAGAHIGHSGAVGRQIDIGGDQCGHVW